MTVKYFGSTGSGVYNLSTGLALSQWTSPYNGTLSEIQLTIYGGLSGYVIAGIYSDSAGEPDALLATTASTEVVNGATRTITIALVSGLAVTAETVYWIAALGNASFLMQTTETVTTRYKSYSYGALPDPAGSGYSSSYSNPLSAAAYGGAPTTNIVLSSPMTATGAFNEPTVTAVDNVFTVTLTKPMAAGIGVLSPVDTGTDLSTAAGFGIDAGAGAWGTGTISAITHNGSYWLIGGMAYKDAGLYTKYARLVKYDGVSFTDLSSSLIGFPEGYYGVQSIGYGDGYWLIAGEGVLNKYDGANCTQLTDDLIASSTILKLVYGSTYWIFYNSTAQIVKYDGSAFTLLRYALPNEPLYENADFVVSMAYNDGVWLFGGLTGELWEYDGTDWTDLSASIRPFIPNNADSTDIYYESCYVSTLGTDWLIGSAKRDILNETPKPVVVKWDGASTWTDYAKNIPFHVNGTTSIPSPIATGTGWHFRTTKYLYFFDGTDFRCEVFTGITLIDGWDGSNFMVACGWQLYLVPPVTYPLALDYPESTVISLAAPMSALGALGNAVIYADNPGVLTDGYNSSLYNETLYNRDELVPPLVTMTIDGVAKRFLVDSFNITNSVNSIPTAIFRLIPGVTATEGDEVIIRDARLDDPIFAGYVKQVTAKFLTTTVFTYECQCQGYEMLTIGDEIVSGDYTAQTYTGKEILTEIFGLYCPTVNVGDYVVSTGVIGTKKPAVNLTDMTLQKAMAEMVRSYKSDGNFDMVWYIDTDLELHWAWAFDGDNSDIVLSDSPESNPNVFLLGSESAGTGDIGADYVHFFKYTCTKTAKCGNIRFYSTSVVTGNCNMALYTSVGNQPGELLTEVSGAIFTGWNYEDICWEAPVTITPGDYFIGFISSVAGGCRSVGGGGTSFYKYADYDTYTFPDTWDDDGFSSDTVIQELAIYSENSYNYRNFDYTKASDGSVGITIRYAQPGASIGQLLRVTNATLDWYKEWFIITNISISIKGTGLEYVATAGTIYKRQLSTQIIAPML